MRHPTYPKPFLTKCLMKNLLLLSLIILVSIYSNILNAQTLTPQQITAIGMNQRRLHT